jgi:hypothetical protein
MRKFNPYPIAGTEPNMRQEMINTLQGSYPEIAKKQRGLLRRQRLPLALCSCISPVTREPDKDHFCPYCHGEGFLWDEIFLDFYKIVLGSEVGNANNDTLAQPGLIEPGLVVFFTSSSETITKNDRIVELVLDVEGEPVLPYQRRALYRIGTPIDFRSDNGKLEYWKLDCFIEERKFLNGAHGE